MVNKSEFFLPKSIYRGKWSPSGFVFNANLQEFTQRVNYICNLQTNGKISPEEAYQQIKILWEQFSRSKQQLEIRD